MSYSFHVKAATATAALELVGAELDKIVADQPLHAKDRDAAFNAAKAFARLLPEQVDGHDVSISVHGSIGWDANEALTGAGVGVSVHFAKAEAAPEAQQEPGPTEATPAEKAGE